MMRLNQYKSKLYRDIKPVKNIVQHKKNMSIITSLIFILLIFLLTIFDLVKPMRVFSENENRKLTQKPEFSVNKLFNGAYTLEYEKYIIDQFIQRDLWISLKTIAEVSLMKKEVNGIYMGKGGYLIEAFRTTDVDRGQLSKNEDRLVEFAKRYAALLGSDRVNIMLIPTASDILGSHLPAFAEVFDQQEVINRVKSSLNISLYVDVSKALKNHLEDYIFYRTDHHWTTKGAFYAYREWARQCGFTLNEIDDYTIEEVSSDFRGTIYSKLNVDFVKPDSIFLYKDGGRYEVEYDYDGVIHDGLYEMSHLDTKDKYAVFLDGNHSLVRIDTDINNGRKLLLIKDSYAHCFAPFTAGHFESVFMIDLRYINISISEFVEQNEITDILFLYNVNSFVNETTLYKLVR